MAILIGIHPVKEALVAGRPLDRVLVAKGAGGPKIQEIVDLCRQRKVAVRFEPREALDRNAGGNSNHQGIVAIGAEKEYEEFDNVVGSDLIIVLDGVEDPHNLGAILRSASAAGAGAVVIPERRAVGVTETVAKAAAGALEHMKIVRVTNIAQAIEKFKKSGYWIYGIDERGDRSYDKAGFDAKTVIVLGAEGNGLHDNVRKACDFLLRIPMSGPIPSLNVSVAAGIVMFDWKRQRGISE
jgi:23S rRNA (guanosine2251-2'-O)-methyltransferase